MSRKSRLKAERKAYLRAAGILVYVRSATNTETADERAARLMEAAERYGVPDVELVDWSRS